MTTACPTCGAAVDEDAATCQVCGTERPSAGSTPPLPPPPPPPPSAGSGPPPAAPGPTTGPAHPSGLPSDVRNFGMAAHLSAFLGAWVALAFVGPLVIWLIKRDEHPFIEHHAKEALNFNLSMLLYAAVAFVASFVLIGIPFLIAIGVGWVVLTIVAAVKAANGEGYRYPLTIRLVS